MAPLFACVAMVPGEMSSSVKNHAKSLYESSFHSESSGRTVDREISASLLTLGMPETRTSASEGRHRPLKSKFPMADFNHSRTKGSVFKSGHEQNSLQSLGFMMSHLIRLLGLLLILCLAVGAQPAGPDLGVAVMGRMSKTDKTDVALRGFLGQMRGIDVILEVQSPDEFFTRLAQLTRQGRRIKYLVVLGHGAAELPHIQLNWHPEAGLNPVDFDAQKAADWVKDSLASRLKAEEEYVLLRLQKSPSESDLAETEQKIERWKRQIPTLTEKIQILNRLESVRHAMAPGASILLLNCSAAASAPGIEFVDNIGRAFLSSGGGSITASRRDLEIYQASDEGKKASAEGNSLVGLARWLRAILQHGQYVSPGDYYVTPNAWTFYTAHRNWYTRPFGAEGEGTPYYSPLAVFFADMVTVASGTQDVTVTPQLFTAQDSGRLTYFWNFAAQGVADPHFLVDVKSAVREYVGVHLRVRDERGREGVARTFVKIPVKKFEFVSAELQPPNPKLGQTVTLKTHYKMVGCPTEGALITLTQCANQGGPQSVVRQQMSGNNITFEGTDSATMKLTGNFSWGWRLEAKDYPTLEGLVAYRVEDGRKILISDLHCEPTEARPGESVKLVTTYQVEGFADPVVTITKRFWLQGVPGLDTGESVESRDDLAQGQGWKTEAVFTVNPGAQLGTVRAQIQIRVGDLTAVRETTLNLVQQLAKPQTFSGVWKGTYANSRNEPGVMTLYLEETGGKVTGTDDGLPILDGRRVGDTMTWRLERDGGYAKGGCTWNMTVQILNGGQTLIQRYTGHDHRSDKDSGSYTGGATLTRQ